MNVSDIMWSPDLCIICKGLHIKYDVKGTPKKMTSWLIVFSKAQGYDDHI